MPIKNYTTSIPVEKTVMQIERILAKHGATGILKEYDDEGRISAVSFNANIGVGQNIAFRLPMKLRAMLNITNKLVKEKKLSQKYRNDMDKAMMIGWRIIKDWIDSQIALIEIEMCDIAEVFLPYAYNGTNTLYDLFKENGFKLLGD